MAWQFKNDRPIYSQILEHIKLSILSGEYKLGSKLPSVRDMAVDAAVNPNTMQKAMMALEQEGLVHTERTAGRYITEDAELVEGIKNQMAKEYIKEFELKMMKIGYEEDQIIQMMRKDEQIG